MGWGVTYTVKYDEDQGVQIPPEGIKKPDSMKEKSAQSDNPTRRKRPKHADILGFLS